MALTCLSSFLSIYVIIVSSILLHNVSACCWSAVPSLLCGCFRSHGDSNKITPSNNPDQPEPNIQFSNIPDVEGSEAGSPTKDNVKWFNIDSGVILRHQNAAVNLMVVSTAFNIAQRTNFLALYLPPDSRSDQQLQVLCCKCFVFLMNEANVIT